MPRSPDATFRTIGMRCYDNTWKLAVHASLMKADVVMMDLRWFSDERKGCEYEVDVLLDTVPLSRVLFLADGASDRSQIENLIRDRWG